MIKCPKCNKTKMHKFGKDPKTGKQKYRCLSCHRQFKLGDGYGRPRNKYPWMPNCPKCNKHMHIYKFRKHFKRLRCKYCNYKFNVYSIPNEVFDHLSKLSAGKTNFLRMRHSKEIVLTAIRLFYEFGLSSRDISKNLFFDFGIRISHVSVYQWCIKFAALFSKNTQNIKLKFSKTWHMDETVIKISGHKYWLFTVLDRSSRFVIAWNLSNSRTIEAAVKTINLAINFAGFKPHTIFSDNHPLYKELILLYPDLYHNHVFVEKFASKPSNNRIERFFGSLKARVKRSRGFKSFYSVSCFLQIYFIYYNYFRLHSALGFISPAEFCGFKALLPDRWASFFSY